MSKQSFFLTFIHKIVQSNQSQRVELYKEVKKMKFLYARVSSIGQNISRQTVNENEFDRVYIDKCSGKNTDRPQLQAMLNNLRPGDKITCKSIDRLARNTFDLEMLLKEISEKGCSVHFEKESLDFIPGENNSISNLTLHIMNAISQFERELIKERQAEGIAIAKAKGKFKGGTKKLSDYDVKELKELVPAKKISIKDAMKRYDISRASVYNYLKREYKGDNDKKDVKWVSE